MVESPTLGSSAKKSVVQRERATIRFAGDSGDGMQLAGNRFTDATAVFGNDFSTLPDFPAEIRAPAGSLAGVSSFQISFSARTIHTPGDAPDALVAMNPAALKVHAKELIRGGLLIVNKDAFTSANLKKAGYTSNPLDDGSLADYRLIEVPITQLASAAAAESGVSKQDAERTKNLFALGVVYWLFDRDLGPSIAWIEEKFAKLPAVVEANKAALKAGHAYGETAELADAHVSVPPASLLPGTYRTITGNEATAIGLVAAKELSGLQLFYGSYPITPASDILHSLASYRNFGVKTFQAEDEIAAVGAAIGAAFGGSIGVTGTSGPGVALKSESIGLAVMTELPLIVLNVQRGGPSTGLPTKTEQGDLLQALYGRNGESPVCVIAPRSPGDCFYMVIEAVRLAFHAMTPVIFLSDGYLANTAEPWPLPDISQLPKIDVTFHQDPQTFEPYRRNPDTLARQYAIPGTPALQHRIGGLEKADGSGNVSYDPDNHQHMIDTRADKIARIANVIPALEIEGPDTGDVLVLSWGSTYGAAITAVEQARADGAGVSLAHLRHLNPFPANLADVLSRFQTVLIPETNSGQLRLLVRAKFLVDAQGLNKVNGQPFNSSEIVDAIMALRSTQVPTHA
ncbi:MAG: 2-oxoglutarate ferredoxin oxidoreductase subunit alpha [Chloroflexi bacterium]|nr:MAG: 2-oxoglutarate ferredoxin oxidoreductase subunit alpha [Chloroflexota bacterium]